MLERKRDPLSGKRLFCRAPTSSSKVRAGQEKLLTFHGLHFCLMYRLCHRRQNSTEILDGNLPAMCRNEYSFQGLICRVEVPRYTLEHRTGKRRA